MPAQDDTTWWETAVDGAVAILVETAQQAIAEFGPIAPGLARADRWTQLDQYLQWRGDEQRTIQLLAFWAQSVGWDEAVKTAIREGLRLEKKLAQVAGWDGNPDTQAMYAQMGADAVGVHEAELALQGAQKDAKQISRVLSLPKWQAGPPITVTDPIQRFFLDDINQPAVGGPVPSFGMEQPPAPAPELPPPPTPSHELLGVSG